MAVKAATTVTTAIPVTMVETTTVFRVRSLLLLPSGVEGKRPLTVIPAERLRL